MRCSSLLSSLTVPYPLSTSVSYPNFRTFLMWDTVDQSLARTYDCFISYIRDRYSRSRNISLRLCRDRLSAVTRANHLKLPKEEIEQPLLLTRIFFLDYETSILGFEQDSDNWNTLLRIEVSCCSICWWWTTYSSISGTTAANSPIGNNLNNGEHPASQPASQPKTPQKVEDRTWPLLYGSHLVSIQWYSLLFLPDHNRMSTPLPCTYSSIIFWWLSLSLGILIYLRNGRDGHIARWLCVVQISDRQTANSTELK